MVNMARGILRTGETDASRVEAFSDGVLAIVITLLILDVKIPHDIRGGNDALWAALREQLPMLGAWVLSFSFVLVFWVAHHYLFKQLTKVDRGILWLNGLFLLSICFTPWRDPACSNIRRVIPISRFLPWHGPKECGGTTR